MLLLSSRHYLETTNLIAAGTVKESKIDRRQPRFDDLRAAAQFGTDGAAFRR